MKTNNSDIFEGHKKTDSGKNVSFSGAEGNFFIENESAHYINFSEPSRRLNDYDSNLLREDAYKDIDDDAFKIEYKISKTEEDIKKLEAQIQSANDIKDYNLAGELQGKLMIMQAEYVKLLNLYKEKSVSARISGKFGSFIGMGFGGKLRGIADKLGHFGDSIMSKLPKQITQIIELKKTLNRLENLNNSVDELVNMNIPYGESFDKYTQLSKYIIKANSIQSDISKVIKKQ